MPATLDPIHHHQTNHDQQRHHQFFNYQTDFGSINQPPPPLSSLESMPPGQLQNLTINQKRTVKQPLSSQYQSNYQSFADIADPSQNPHLFIHVAPGQKISRPWQGYISDLDDFFELIYKYYRKSGFLCIVVENILELFEILLVVSLTFFFLNCVDYEILFKRKIPPGHPNQNQAPLKITIADCIIPLSEVTFSSLQVILLVFAVTFWFTKFGVAVYSILSNYAIRSFFIEALQIHDPSLYSWQEVQNRLIQAQSHCLLRESHLDELAIHNRLLRRANYMIALVNKGVLPIYYRLPILGECIYLTSGFEFNLNILLFRGMFSMFDKNWKLRDEVKSPAERLECARRFSNRCIAVGVVNLILLPMIFMWQSLYAFYTYVEAMKRDPTIFSSRTWSRYGRWFCRHFNELDHELDQRLNRGHRPALRYMNSFTAPLLEIFARFVTFIAGILLSVLIVLTVYDEDVITVEHILTLMTGLGAAIAIARAFLPDPEPSRWSFAELDAAILQHIHYRPHNYPPHTIQARNAMANIFVYKSTTIIEELISPLVVPYILIRHLRSRSLEIIDFFRVYTLELTDIGDVCTFSQFDFHQNGHRIFNQPPNLQSVPPQQPMTPLPSPVMQPTTSTANLQGKNTAEVLADECHTTRNGKLELSLINFKLKNPKWEPSDPSQKEFIGRFTKQSQIGPIFPIVPRDENDFIQNPEREICESKSTIDFPSQSSSAYLKQSQQHQSMMKTSQMSDSNLFLERDSSFGFGEKRRQLLKLRYASVFSEQEERDNQMALSSLYFHQMVSDSLQPTQQQQFEHQDGSAMELQGPSSSYGQFHHSQRKISESIPLLRSEEPIRPKDDDEEDLDE